MNIGNQIYQLRKISGMTQEQLSEKLNISRQTLSKWENGNSIPDIESVIKISALFQVSLEELLLEEEKNMEQKNTQITIEDLAQINAHNRKMNLLFFSGLIFIAIAIIIAAFENMLKNITLRLTYILYRYMVTGQYEAAPINYTLLLIPAMISGTLGIGLCLYYFIKSKKK